MVECILCDLLHPRGSEKCPARRVGMTILGKYQIDRIIGAGGMGAVYSAHHLALKRNVALKMIHADYIHDAEVLQRFVREVQEQAAIEHPGIVDVYDAGTAEDGAYYLVMEKLDGQTLHDLIHADDHPMEVERALHHALSLLDVLAAIHDAGLIHRDLKPLNIFVAERYGREQVKILDFGVAKVEDGKALTQFGQQIGTLMYMPPEQITDPRGVDARADLFSVGVILFEMLTQRWPVEAESSAQRRAAILTGNLVRNPRQFRPELPDWLDAAVCRALQHDPAARFTDARAMSAALHEGAAPIEEQPKSWLSRVFRK